MKNTSNITMLNTGQVRELTPKRIHSVCRVLDKIKSRNIKQKASTQTLGHDGQ